MDLKRGRYGGLCSLVVALGLGCSGGHPASDVTASDSGPSSTDARAPDDAGANGRPDAASGTPSPSLGGTSFDGAIRAQPADSTAFLFDDTALRTYELVLPEENLAFLDADPRAEVYTEGLLRFQGRDIGPVGVRYKGSVGAFRGCVDATLGNKTCTKLSLKVKINWTDPKADLHGVRKLQFHSMNRDASMMKERLGYWIFRQAGVVAPRAVHARLVINGQLQGLYALVEEIDGRFTRSRFVEGGEGNLFKEVWPLASSGAPIDVATLQTQLRTNEDENPSFDGMLALGAALAAAPAAEVPLVLAERMNADYLMRYVAVDRALRHDDGPFHWYCMSAASCYTHNFYFYEELDQARFWIVAWDLDSAFNVDNLTTTIWFDWDDATLGCEPRSNPPFSIPLRAPVCDPAQRGMALMQRQYLDATRALLDGPMRREVLEERLLEWEQQIYPVVLEAAAAHADAPTFEAWQRGRAWLRASIDRVLAEAEARVARGPLPESALLPPDTGAGGAP